MPQIEALNLTLTHIFVQTAASRDLQMQLLVSGRIFFKEQTTERHSGSNTSVGNRRGSKLSIKMGRLLTAFQTEALKIPICAIVNSEKSLEISFIVMYLFK